MDAELKNKIEAFAGDVLLVYGISSPIRDMKEVVQKIGGVLIEDESMTPFANGTVQKERNGEVKFSIRIPKSMPDSRKNFAVAKCLGKLFLFMGYAVNEDLWNSENWKNASEGDFLNFEIRANEFAAAFLMPREEYRKVLKEYTKENQAYLKPIADYFNISQGDVSFRGEELEMLDPFR